MPVEVASAYAESVALVGYTEDLASEVSVRLARFPVAGAGTLWAVAIIGGKTFGLGEPIKLSSAAQATPVNSETALYDERGPASARFLRHHLSLASFDGAMNVTAPMHATGHPPPGPGTVPVGIEASFSAIHAPVLARDGRREVFGVIDAKVTTPDGPVAFSGPAKWHEQSGDRTAFAPRFTYIAVSNRERALLAVAREDSDYGFAVIDGKTVQVVKVTVGPMAERRSLKVVLEDGRKIAGTLDVVHETSMPVEGRRRLSTTVMARTSIGDLVGHANDWDPKA
ncbi:MAG: hypothetical protein H6923_00940 [Alphaproteobacteria bacterium]|nr:hypothetical protein [Alphaproteobacteria bacterium]